MAESRAKVVNIPVITAILALLSVFPPVATDMYLSAMDDLAGALHASRSATEMSLSIFFLGLCVGQVAIGPLIDGYGRKGPLLVGAALFTVTSIALLLVRDVTIFNTLRFFQALGACVGMVVGRAVVSDLLEGRAAAKMMTVLVMLMTLGPILSPFLGSLLLSVLGWQSIFVAMILIGLVALVLAWAFLPETLPREDRSDRAFAHAMKHAGQMLIRVDYIAPALVAALIQAAMFAFITGSSGIFQGIFGLGNVQYGLLFALVAAALVIFGQVNSRLLNHFSPEQILSAGLPLTAVLGLILLLVSGTGVMWIYLVPVWFCIGMVGLLTANAMSVAMEGGRAAPGMASALMGGCQFGLAFANSTAVAIGGSHSTLPMSLGLFVPGALAFLLWYIVVRPRLRATTNTAE